ncbi:MAG: hypothetical protein ACRDFC_09145 [Ignavibacteria bacterium]
MFIKKIILLSLVAFSLQFTLSSFINAQIKSNNEFWKWTTWTILQTVPSITYFEDRNEKESRLKFGLEWQIIPFAYSFNSNKYVSKLQFFYIKPPKRFSGSAELFFQPQYVTGEFKYSPLKKFMFKSGMRLIFPVAQRGEYLSFSLGLGYYYQKTLSGERVDGMTYEAAVYTFFGMLGLKFNYNQNAQSRYNIGLYFKYY